MNKVFAPGLKPDGRNLLGVRFTKADFPKGKGAQIIKLKKQSKSSAENLEWEELDEYYSKYKFGFSGLEEKS